MNLSDIITKCYILALFIRDDGERLLLGDGFFEFKESLQHFQPNTFVNDVVELQGTDGQLLAGQVRRTAVQTFEGYIGDGTIGREQTETNRRRFLQFFRKKHFYTVVYILPDGSAVQRDRGYIVNAPSAPELYQRFPEYSVGLNFEDPNYYEYDEDSEGDEIPAHSVVLSIANLLEGGLIWDAFGAVSNEKTWLDWENGITVDGLYTFNNGLAGAPLEFTQLDGNATQKTLSGKNLACIETSATKTIGGVAFTIVDGVLNISSGTTAGYSNFYFDSFRVPNSGASILWFEVSGYTPAPSDNCTLVLQESSDGSTWTNASQMSWATAPAQQYPTLDSSKLYRMRIYAPPSVVFNNAKVKFQLEYGSTKTDFEPYCGGAPSPNPDYPQPVEVVAGLQTVKMVGKNLINQVETHNGVSGSGSIATMTAGYLGIESRISVMPNTSYAVSFEHDIAGAGLLVGYWDAEGNFLGRQSLGTVRTFATPANASEAFYYLYKGDNPFTTIGGWTQLEFGNQPSQYEPYQEKKKAIALDFNIYDKDALTPGYLNSSGEHITGGSASVQWRITDYLPITGGATYRTSGMPNGSGLITARCYYDASKTFISGVAHNNVDPFTNTAPATAHYMRESVHADTINNIIIVDTSRTPYELAKIPGTNYKDAFKRIDGVWYKHAEIGKAIWDGSESWTTASNYCYHAESDAYVPESRNVVADILCDNFTPTTYTLATGTALDYAIALDSNNAGRFALRHKDYLSASTLKTWLSTHNTTVYYALATPTDTEITEPELLAQLNAIASTFDGVNNITITPSAGAQGELSVHYATGSIDVGAGYEWEEGSDTGTNVIVNNGIDSVFPTWIVPGPATNPTLTNITTGQTIVWEGSVASGQTLTVDLNRQTAELGGTNVFAQLSGDWVQLAPGPNKLAYSATGATEGCRLEWNGVVG